MVRGNRDHAAQTMCCRLQANWLVLLKRRKVLLKKLCAVGRDTFQSQRLRSILNRGIEIASLSGNAARGHAIYQRLTLPDVRHLGAVLSNPTV